MPGGKNMSDVPQQPDISAKFQPDYTLKQQTTKVERTQALMDARKLLSDLVFGANTPDALRAEAQRIWQHFPFPYELHHAAVNCPILFDAKTVIPAAYKN
jgi:hypothetical protein